MSEVQRKSSPVVEVIGAGVYTLTLGDGKSASYLLEEVHTEWYGVGSYLLSLRDFILSPKFRIQKEPGVVDLKLVDLPTNPLRERISTQL